MKSGLSWFSNRDAHVEHGIRNAIFPPDAEAAPVEAPLVPHPTNAIANTAADAPTAACILFIEPPVM
jgi:hypothetical protein